MKDEKQQQNESETGTSQAMQRTSSSGVGRYRDRPERGALSPFGLVGRMMADMDRLFGRDFGLPSLFDDGFFPGPANGWSPQVEVFERNGNLVVRADLPGVEQKDVQLQVDDGALTIHGERRAEHEDKRDGYYRSERSYGSFERRIPLPRGIDTTSCDAKFENGVLEVTMKLPASNARSIPIRGGEAQPQASKTVTPQNGSGPQSQPARA